MNKIGTLGQGESVWVGWFLLTIFHRFIPVVEGRGDAERAARYREEAERLERNIAEHAWDGAWYRRAYFDDGTPLGSSENDECQIDSLPQSWAVIAGSDPKRAEQAVESAHDRLVRYDDGLVQLFTPPFDKSDLDPGYIKGYLPGIRENGGQYTHAAFWLIQALALQGKGTRAFRIFDLVNPVRHASSPDRKAEDLARDPGLPAGAKEISIWNADHYKVEPYVVAADVYGVPPHTGRGGWTWYTGSASWMYRTALESLLGFQLRGDHFAMNPCIPADWPGFELDYRHGETTYHIRVENPRGAERGVQAVAVDGEPRPDQRVPLYGDGRAHEVRVTLG
jgi:cyclic beta-1,2-glucan synthetase